MQNILTETSAKKRSKMVKPSEIVFPSRRFKHIRGCNRSPETSHCDAITGSRNATAMTDFRFRWLKSTAPETSSVSFPATGTFREKTTGSGYSQPEIWLDGSGALWTVRLPRARNIGRERINPKRSCCRRLTLKMAYSSES